MILVSSENQYHHFIIEITISRKIRTDENLTKQREKRITYYVDLES